MLREICTKKGIVEDIGQGLKLLASVCCGKERKCGEIS